MWLSSVHVFVYIKAEVLLGAERISNMSEHDFIIKSNSMEINKSSKDGKVEYIEKASFSMQLLKHIDAGVNSGFVTEVYCSMREQSK